MQIQDKKRGLLKAPFLPLFAENPDSPHHHICQRLSHNWCVLRSLPELLSRRSYTADDPVFTLLSELLRFLKSLQFAGFWHKSRCLARRKIVCTPSLPVHPLHRRPRQAVPAHTGAVFAGIFATRFKPGWRRQKQSTRT